VCGKQFTQKHHLSRHFKIHTGEKNFVCAICEKSFLLKSHLDQHLKVHTGEKPHSCDKCGKSFTSSGNASRHKLKCKGKSQQNETVSTSEIQFVDYGETIKEEIKEESESEDEINPSDYLKSEFCEDINFENCEIITKSEHEAESIDCEETIKGEIKQEIQETEDMHDPLSTEDFISTEDLIPTDIEDESFVVKMEDNL